MRPRTREFESRPIRSIPLACLAHRIDGMRRDEEDLVTPARVDATCAPGGGGPQCLRNEKLSFPPAESCRLRAMPTISRGPTSLRSGPDFEATWNVTVPPLRVQRTDRPLRLASWTFLTLGLPLLLFSVF